MDELDALLKDLQTTVTGSVAIDGTQSLHRPVPKPKVGQNMSGSPSMYHTALTNASSTSSTPSKQQEAARSKVSSTLTSSLSELDTLLDELSSSKFVDQLRDANASDGKSSVAVQKAVVKLSRFGESNSNIDAAVPKGLNGSNSSLSTSKTASNSSLNYDYSRPKTKGGDIPLQPRGSGLYSVPLRVGAATKQKESIAADSTADSSNLNVSASSANDLSLMSERSFNTVHNARLSTELPAAGTMKDSEVKTNSSLNNDTNVNTSVTAGPQVDALSAVQPADQNSVLNPKPNDAAKQLELDSLMDALNSSMDLVGADPPKMPPAAPNVTTTSICAGCEKPITSGQLLTALSKSWHPNHFVCTHCEDALGTSNYYERNGKPYCETCYIRLYSARCAKCSEPIVDRCVTALNKTWHVEHFACTTCGCLFDSIGFLVRDEKPYCPTDYYELFGTRCAGCQRPITDRFVTALNAVWHSACFVCQECRKPFADGVFNELDGAPYCTAHYNARRGTQCATCSKPVAGRCVTALFRKYHPECFCCAFCSTVLNRGVFKEHDDRPYCNPCYTKFIAAVRE